MTEKKENPLLKKISLPGQRFRIPSRGIFYNDGELSEEVVDGEVEVLSMTTIDEIALRTPEFLFSGEAITRVFNRCIPEINKPLQLLSQDVDFLLTCLRVVSYGNTMSLEVRCDKCEEVQNTINKQKEEEFIEEVRVKAIEQNYDLDEAMSSETVVQKLINLRSIKVRKQMVNIDLKGILTNNTKELADTDHATFVTTLSNSQRVEMRPLQFDSAVIAFKYQNEDFSQDLTKIEDYVNFLLSSRIKSVDGESDSDLLYEWVGHLPVGLKDELNKSAGKQAQWGTTFDYMMTCEDCGHERNINTLLNPINFFTSLSESEEPNS